MGNSEGEDLVCLTDDFCSPKGPTTWIMGKKNLRVMLKRHQETCPGKEQHARDLLVELGIWLSIILAA